jgi:hypothetical protein
LHHSRLLRNVHARCKRPQGSRQQDQRRNSESRKSGAVLQDTGPVWLGRIAAVKDVHTATPYGQVPGQELDGACLQSLLSEGRPLDERVINVWIAHVDQAARGLASAAAPLSLFLPTALARHVQWAPANPALAAQVQRRGALREGVMELRAIYLPVQRIDNSRVYRSRGRWHDASVDQDPAAPPDKTDVVTSDGQADRHWALVVAYPRRKVLEIFDGWNVRAF